MRRPAHGGCPERGFAIVFMTSVPRWRLHAVLGRALLCVMMLGATAWGALALYHAGGENALVRSSLAGALAICGVATAVAVAVRRARRRALLAFAALFAGLLGWWTSLEPSNDRDWQPDVARLAHADIDGGRITVHNIRNFDYRSETDFTPAYYDRTYDLTKLESVDLIAVYWMGPAIAHTILSFGFAGGEYLAVSIETRKERSEAYSTAKGFFRQYELYYVVADERDVVRLRTNYRKDPPEDVYIYRVQGDIENGRRLFLEYVRRINELKARPAFYNTLLDNCTTGIWMNTRINPGHLPVSWKVLASGYLPQHLYENGRLAGGVSFAELQRLGHANARAQAADQATDFSRRIRAGIPGMQTDAVPAGEGSG